MSRAMRRSLRLGGALLLLILVGLLGRSLVPKAVRRGGVLETPVVANASGLGPGLSIAVLGGLRQVVANYFWLSGYLQWEQRDAAAAEASFALAVAADPGEWFFWTNGTRMIAYDFPQWEMRAWRREFGDWPPPEKVAQIRQKQADRALRWLDAAEAVFPDDPRVEIERAMIYLHAVEDRRAAAGAFRAAWEKPGAPLFTARIHAELLRSVGDLEAACAWYHAWLEELPPEVRKEQEAIVLPRLESMEAILRERNTVSP